jgi:hypothetical protein
MPATGKTYSPEIRRWASRLQRRRMSGITLSSWRPFRQRLSWTQALVDRLAHPAMRAFGAERTLLRGARLSRHRSHWFAPQFHVSWQTMTAVTWPGSDRKRMLPLAAIAPERRVLLRAREFHSQSTTFLRTGFLRQSTHNHTLEVSRHTSSTIMLLSAAARDAMARLTVDDSFVRSRSNAEPELLSLATRVLRQSRRIEEQVTPVHTILVRRFPSSSHEAPFTDSAPPLQVRTPVGNSPWAVPPPQPGFNINQITDEVVRKLDSRLVAARERFGKI